MSTEQLTPQAPRTRVCRTCSLEINASSARCPYCGARQFRRQRILGLPGLLVCLVAVAVAVLVTRTVVDAANSGLRYVPYRSNDLVMLVPEGYTDELLAGPHGTAVAGFVDPSTAANSEMVRATLPAAGTPSSRAAALAATLRNTPGVALGQVFAVTLPGGQPASELIYTEAGVDYAVFEYDACKRRIGVTLTMSASRLSLLDAFEDVLPESAYPICDGPDFSDRDRADTSVPLRS
jgi:DNA-directed RNA polymerase subunit RPC12/RpoP